MQIIFYIIITYIISVLCNLIVFTIYYFDNKTNVMDKDDFYKIILLAVFPVFNILLLFAISAITICDLLINFKNKLKKK